MTVRLTIDGKELEARPGETVLELARREGIAIPALCHEPGTPAWGGCRLCLVEIEGLDKLQAACTTWVADGLVVKTDTPRVRARRTSYLKMYLSDHNAYCEAPCTHACPTHVDIAGFLALLAEGDFAGAAALVREELPFPGILGRICPAYCEPVCRRAEVDEPIAICALHRALGDHTPAHLVTAATSGRRVAVLGAGPAGLSAAWFLTARGHQVTLYDEEAKPGGRLRYALPEFRLPEAVLDRELEPLWQAGARFVGGSRISRELGGQELLAAGFDAVVVSTGREPQPAAAGTLDGLRFLRQVREGKPPRLEQAVIVVGSGITALDAARAARRLGAESVRVVRTDGKQWAATDKEAVAAREEGIVLETTTAADAAAETMAGRGAVTLIRAEDMRAEEGDTGSLDSRDVLPASPMSKSAAAEGLAADPFTGRTELPGLFRADAVTGGSRTAFDSAIHAVAAGKRTALAVDAWLRGEDLPELEARLAAYVRLPYLEQLRRAPELGDLGRRLVERDPVWLKMGIQAEPGRRVRTPKASLAQRLAGVEVEVEKSLGRAAAQAEAKRCLQCECPSLGACELQRLGVEYGIVDNELVRKGARVRVLAPQYEHPFIRRDMQRCIACGRCVRVCREVAGPACYDFTGRGFTIKVDTPYGEALQLADCISCGRCVTACPTGALTFNERRLTSFRVDETRCILCRQCVEVCPVDALVETSVFEEARREWLRLVEQGSRLAGGHRMCAGCGAPIVVRQVLMATSDPVVVSAATGCLEVSTTIYPYTSWKNSFIHTAFENAAATLSGVETAYRALKKKGVLRDEVRFIAFGGDGGTYDIGLQSLSGAMERGHRMLYVCYDNGAYMNTGFQRSGATPRAAWTTTSPVGEESAGKLQHRKNLTELMIAHGIPYVAQASPHDPRDLVRKAAKALSIDGPTFLNVLAPCPRGWRADGAETIDLAREAVNTCYWPLFEYEEGQYRLTYRPRYKRPLASWLKRQGRFAHLFQPGFEEALHELEEWVDEEWEKLLRKCGEPSEAEWQARLTANGCLLR
jgi:pyruvate ferredoxin oxidoreductase beta subunit